MTATAVAPGSWADVLGEGRAPRFALICLGVWLNAADSLVTATIMPSVGRALGGYAYFGWATALYLLGSVMAGASSGVLALRFGLRSATTAGAAGRRRAARRRGRRGPRRPAAPGSAEQPGG